MTSEFQVGDRVHVHSGGELTGQHGEVVEVEGEGYTGELTTRVLLDGQKEPEWFSDDELEYEGKAPNTGRCPVDGSRLDEDDSVIITTPWGPRTVRYFVCHENRHTLYVENVENKEG